MKLFVLALVALLALSGCLEISPVSPTGPPAAPKTPFDSNVIAPLDSNGFWVDSNAPSTELPSLEPIPLVLGVDANRIVELVDDNGVVREVLLPIAPACLDDACFAGLRLLNKADQNRRVIVRVADKSATAGVFEAENNAGNVGFAYFLGPTTTVDCFEVSQLQFRRHGLDQKHIASYCANARRMAALSGLDFNGSFKLMVFAVDNPSMAAFYLGNRSFVVDEFSLGGQQVWIVLTHEFVHHGARFHYLPAWFEEGLADFLSYTVNREIIGKPPGAPDIRDWNPLDPALETWEHSRNYNQSAWLLKAFFRDHAETNLSQLLDAYRGLNVPAMATNSERNRALEIALQTILDDQNYSLDDYFNEK